MAGNEMMPAFARSLDEQGHHPPLVQDATKGLWMALMEINLGTCCPSRDCAPTTRPGSHHRKSQAAGSLATWKPRNVPLAAAAYPDQFSLSSPGRA
jgi:hypothetical protein